MACEGAGVECPVGSVTSDLALEIIGPIFTLPHHTILDSAYKRAYN